MRFTDPVEGQPPSPYATAAPRPSGSTSTTTGSTSATSPRSPRMSSTHGRKTARKASTRSCSPPPATWSPSSTSKPKPTASTGAAPAQGRRLADGNTAHVGDTIITRSNDRRLRLGANDWVKNGDRWTVHHIHRDGSLTVQHQRTGRPVTLPADYVAAAAELGYATTIHGAQGITADTIHGLATGQETRQQLYTMLTRGAAANHLYLQVVGDGDPHDLLQPQNVRPPTATEILEHILARDDAPTSATTTAREHASPTARLGAATGRYLDALHVAAEHHLGTTAIAHLEAGADRLIPDIADDPAWPTLRAHLILLAATGAEPLTALHIAAGSRELDTADDRAAVLNWRLGDPSTAGTGPLPWLPGIPQELRDDQRWGAYLTARSGLVADLAGEVRHRAISTEETPRPGGPLVAPFLRRTCSVTWLSGEPPTPSPTPTTGSLDPLNQRGPTRCGSTTSTPAWAAANLRR